MPLYEFTCAEGHTEERLAPRGAEAVGCRMCGGIASRSTVPTQFAYTGGWPDDPSPPADFHRLNREALDAKREAIKEKEAAIANGWRSNQ